MPPNANTHTRAKPHVCPRTPRPQHSYPVQHPGSSHGGLLHTPQLRRSTLPQPSSCMHRCHRTRSSTYMTASTSTIAKVRTVRGDPTSYTSRADLDTRSRSQRVLPIHPRHMHHRCKHGISRLRVATADSILALHHLSPIIPCPLSAPDRRCYCSAWFPSQHLCPRRRILRIAISRKPMSTPPGRRATR